MAGNPAALCEVAYRAAGFFNNDTALNNDPCAMTGGLASCGSVRTAADRKPLPRSCREIALERAESSAVVSVARRQGVDKARKIRWLTYGRVFRPGKVGLPARVLSLIP